MSIIKRALAHGFKLDNLPNYSDDSFREGLYTHLVHKRYFVTEEGNKIFIGVNILDDVAEVIIKSGTMKVKPLVQDEVFFTIFVELLKYISICSEVVKKTPLRDEDISTEDYSEDSSEEWWL